MMPHDACVEHMVEKQTEGSLLTHSRETPLRPETPLAYQHTRVSEVDPIDSGYWQPRVLNRHRPTRLVLQHLTNKSPNRGPSFKSL